MDAIERAKKHWSDQLVEVRKILVPEWGDEGEPLEIIVKPANLAQRNKISIPANEGSLEAYAQTLITRAKDKDGRPIFAPKDKTTIMTGFDPVVVERVCGDINSDLQDEETIQGAVKN